MRSEKHGYRKFLVVFLTLLLAWGYTGCTSQDGGFASDTATVTKSLSPTPLRTIRSTATVTVEPAPSYTSSPTAVPTPTVTPLPVGTATWTPVPTLAPAAALEALLRLYSTNGGCELPCWWGITPGATTWAEARTKLAPLGRLSGPWGEGKTVRYDFAFDMPESLDPFGYFEPSLGVRDNMVVGIGLSSQWVKPDFDYSLAGILHTFGAPDEIRLRVITDTPYQPYYDISLFYAVKGMLFGASDIAQVQGSHLIICPQAFRLDSEFQVDSYPPGLLLWDPSTNLNYQAVSYSTMGTRNANLPDFHLLEELSDDFDREDLYETYLDPQTTVCFDIDPVDQP